MRITLLFVLGCAVGACGGAVAPTSDGNDGGSPDTTSPAPCVTGADCTASQYCDRAGTCGANGARGACKNRPAACPEILAPVCGCDKQSYENACLANAAGTDVGTQSCPAQTGSFLCGNTATFCSAATQYCQRTSQPGQPTSGACLPLPASCQNNSVCACFPPNTPCLSAASCREIPIPDTHTFGLEITCPGG